MDPGGAGVADDGNATTKLKLDRSGHVANAPANMGIQCNGSRRGQAEA